MFSGIENAEIFERGNYIVPNYRGILEVKSVIKKKTRRSGEAFIVEFEVITSNRDEHPVGSKVTWFQKLSDTMVAFPSIKALVAALCGFESFQKSEIEATVSPNLDNLLTEACKSPSKNDLVGQKVSVVTTQIKTQKGLDFTRHDWQPAGKAA
jgi:hypothetical protein